ncbi:hypothetical protein FJW01_18480 [Pantoea deleyi]|uniref:Uncharacterized protein n=1 Tax=Pantoea deleyi TaxID=470932 RepID=A0A506PWY1_9GAMM|nr:hypothetical protein [Pantoea deleyi]TPV37997.1 hypothetical protein FJW01_18480 [Pantoea deleyi]
MIKRIFFLSTVGLAVALTAFTIWYRYGITSGFSCSGNVNFHRESGILRLSTKLNIDGNSGTLSMNGFVTREDGTRENVNRTVVFTSHHVGSRYTWVSDEILASIDDKLTPEMASAWFPAFYREPKSKVELFISRLNINSVMLSGEFVPYYVCTQRH